MAHARLPKAARRNRFVQTVAERWPGFRERMEESGGLPRFVQGVRRVLEVRDRQEEKLEDYALACDSGLAMGCFNLGVQYRKSTAGVADDKRKDLIAKAIVAFEKGCRLKYGSACVSAAYHRFSEEKAAPEISGDTRKLANEAGEVLAQDEAKQSCNPERLTNRCVDLGEALADLGGSLGMDASADLSTEYDTKADGYQSALCKRWPSHARCHIGAVKRGYGAP